MNDLLTARDLQDLLRVDRMTVYRMIKDGRVPAFKVGGQWRFSRPVIEAWLAEQQTAAACATADPEATVPLTPEALPLSCIQAIQGVFAESLDLGAVVTTRDGVMLTAVSNSCAFCEAILGSPTGRQRCMASWQALGLESDPLPRLARCHAGLTYARGRIEVGQAFIAMIFAGQFLTAPRSDDEWASQIAALARTCELDPAVLDAARSRVRVIDERESERVLRLLRTVAATFSEIGEERLSLLSRLRRIAEITAV